MKDVVVIVPGILGSALRDKNGKEIWGPSTAGITGTILSLGQNFQRLGLPDGVGHDDPQDGIEATRLMPKMHLLPAFWKIDGYGRMVEFLEQRFALSRPTPDQPGNLVLFPYDWRLSNVLNARRLADRVTPELERWRQHTKHRDAKLILICHSMGGLIARWFLEVLDGGVHGRDHARKLITIGTPYQGAMPALERLVNGFSLGLGPLSMNLDTLVRSLPSVYQLLPTYECLDVGDGQLQALSDVALPNVGNVNVREGISFHTQITDAVTLPSSYQTIAIKGQTQPTAQSALLSNGMIEAIRSHKGTDHRGDGTVARPSAHPPEWADEAGVVFAAQQHPMLQSSDSILQQLYGVLTGHLGKFMGGHEIGLDMPPLVAQGEAIQVRAFSEEPALPLQVSIAAEDGGQTSIPVLMTVQGDGSYFAELEGVASGAYRVTVQSAAPSVPVEPVADILLVWNEGLHAK